MGRTKQARAAGHKRSVFPLPGPRGACRFLHQRLAAELRRRIGRGDYPPKARVPSVTELVQEFGVSAITARRAIGDLVREGLLVGRPGSGVFVASSKLISRSLAHDTPQSLREEMRRAGVEPGIRDVTVSLVQAPDWAAERLGLAPGSVTYRLDRTILGDGEPISLGTAYLTRAVGDAIGDDLFEGFLDTLVTSHRIPVDHMDYRFSGGAASEEQAQRLALPIGFPLLVVHYSYVAPDGAAIAAGEFLCRSDRITFQMCARPEVHRPAPGRHP